jgi:hypothetical protein
MKLVAIGGAILLLVLGILLWQVTSDDSHASSAGSDEAASAGAGSSRSHAITPAAPAKTAIPDANPAAPDAEPGVFRPRSTEFWDRVDEVGRDHLVGSVTDCYKGGEDLKAKIKVTYRLSIVKHEVTLRDVTLVESTVVDKRFEDCVVSTLAKLRWTDEEMPDFETPATEEPEDFLLRVENLKRHFKGQKLPGR